MIENKAYAHRNLVFLFNAELDGRLGIMEWLGRAN
jgi:hypothetical protein